MENFKKWNKVRAIVTIIYLYLALCFLNSLHTSFRECSPKGWVKRGWGEEKRRKDEEEQETEKKKAKKGKKDEEEKTFVHSLLKRDKSLGFRAERLSQSTNVTRERLVVHVCSVQ